MNDPITCLAIWVPIYATIFGVWYWLHTRPAGPLDPDDPTPKQIRYALFLEIEIPPRCSRRQLSRLIDRRQRG